MSISNTTNKVIYQGDGSTTEFPFSFRIFEETDLVVSLYEIATGIETELTLNSDYTVTINGDNGGTVIMATAPSSSYKLIIKRILPLTQETDYVEGDPFPAESHERALDKLTMITQQLDEEIDRTIKLDATQTNVETILPIPEPMKYLRWNSRADELENASCTATNYPSDISSGLDADKNPVPAEGDIYIATDSQKLYVCHSTRTWTEYKTHIPYGLDADKNPTPAEGDIYIATDSQKVYVCHSTGTWTEYKVNILSGTDANKPTTYKQNRFYWATDTKKLYWDNGSSWTDISAQFSVNYANNADKVDNKDASAFFQKAETGEINALTEKTTLNDNDIVLIEDSEANYAKKKAKKSNFIVTYGSLSPYMNIQVFTSSGTFIKPSGIDKVFVEVIGGGGGGGNGGTGSGGGGGGGGGYSAKICSITGNVSVTIGAGGSGGGNSGGTSSFGSFCSASGGSGGSSGGSGGDGGSGSNGDINCGGNDGAIGDSDIPGNGGSSHYGGGGRGRTGVNGGAPGKNYGGGGGGGYGGYAGGSGASGVVIVRW